MALFYEVLVSYDIEDNKNRKKLFDELKDMGFYLLNFDFMETISNVRDVEQSITLFSEWLYSASDDEIEERYNQSLEKSIQNRHKLMEYLNDYSEMENIFKKLLK